MIFSAGKGTSEREAENKDDNKFNIGSSNLSEPTVAFCFNIFGNAPENGGDQQNFQCFHERLPRAFSRNNSEFLETAYSITWVVR